MQKKFVAVLLLLVALLGGAAFLISRQGKAPVLVSRNDPPKIRFEESLHELGTVTEGVEVPYVFKISNVGGEPLIIKSASASCGCTILNIKDKFIEPGKTGALEVIMDTSMKQGYVRKQIDVVSNDPEHPKMSIYLAATVVPTLEPEAEPDKPSEGKKPALLTKVPASSTGMTNPHAGLTEKGRAKIFTGNCASCHVQMGKGKLGGDLFQADCAMCHGQNAEGAVGPALVPGDYHDPAFAERMGQVVRYGSERHLSMPGFLNEAGGPLTEAEIQSIEQFLQAKSDQMKAQNASALGG